jgi:leucyl aminopeptidase
MFKLPLFSIHFGNKQAPNADTAVIGVYQESNKKAMIPKGPYSQTISQFNQLENEIFTAQLGAIQFLRFTDLKDTLAPHTLFVGLGSVKEFTEEKARQAAGHVMNRARIEKSDVLVVDADSIGKNVRAFAEGLILTAYEFKKYQTDDKKPRAKFPEKIVFVTNDKKTKSLLESELPKAQAIGEAANVTRDWSNEPSNLGTPEYYAGEAAKLAKRFGLKCRILSEQDAKKEKMGLYLGVGQGSEREGKIVVLEYTPKNSKKTVALVGKGITFDSGGISIKPALKMEEMKHDMTGAATVMGALILASLWEVKNKVVGILAFTENMPDGTAIQPGNVLTSRSGKTVEIINTDAEGRLILADVLDYACDMKPNAIIDIATLTGAVGIALGKMCCAVLGNNESLIKKIQSAGDIHGERIWQLPLYDEYFEDMKSDCADIKNSVNDSYGGTIRGAIFLKQFIKKDIAWAHLDVAYTCYNASPYQSYLPKKGANGAYVRTLAQFAADF